WQNRDGFVLPVVRILAQAAGSPWRGALPPEDASVAARSRWRAAWLRAMRGGVSIAVLLAVLRRRAEPDAGSAPPGHGVSGMGLDQWLAGLPERFADPLGRVAVHAGAALLAAWIANVVLLAFWHAWVAAEQDQLLEHDPPTGTTGGQRAFAAAAMLIVT